MNAAWNHIARSIFERSDIENVGLEELDYLVEEYPYFPVIHFLRTRKILADHLPEAESGASRTALYFANPHWLQHQLEAVRPVEQHELPLAEIMTTPSQADELNAVMESDQSLPPSEVIQEETEMDFDDKRIFSEPKVEDQATVDEVHHHFDEINLQSVENEVVSEIIVEEQTGIAGDVDEQLDVTDEIQTAPAEIVPERNEIVYNIVAEPVHVGDSIPVVTVDELSDNIPHEESEDELLKPEQIIELEESMPVEAELSHEEAMTMEPETVKEEITGQTFKLSFEQTPFEEKPAEEELSEAPTEQEPANDIHVAEFSETSTEQEPANDIHVAEFSETPTEQEITKEKTEEEESFEVPIEPLYSIDYFASQGIRLRQEEEMQNDKLSVKLRSFTEWLKAMKKIHPEKLDHKMGQEEENNIRVYAESSNEPKELYTEALAEVYLQQGLRHKAAMVFEKLSLLDPSKSAYFAARIREIKE
jgi:hypothetical protein